MNEPTRPPEGPSYGDDATRPYEPFPEPQSPFAPPPQAPQGPFGPAQSPPYGQPPYSQGQQPPYGQGQQPPYGQGQQPPYGQPPQAPPPGYGTPPPYGAPPPPYGTPKGSGQPPYGTPPPAYGGPPNVTTGGTPPPDDDDRTPFLLVGAAIVVAVLLAAGAWFLFLRTPSSGTAVASPTPTARATAAASASPQPTRTPKPQVTPKPTARPTAVPSPSPTAPPATAAPTEEATTTPGTSPSEAPPSEPAASPSEGASGSPAAGATLDPAIAAQIDQIVAGVPPIRGLQPKKDVPYRSITEEQFGEEFKAQFAEENPPDQVAAEEALYQRLGILDPGMSLGDEVIQLYSGAVAGFYDPKTGTFTLVQNTGTLGPADEITVSHEYDHALQDQYWDLEGSRIKDPSQGDAAAAQLGLTEGDATALMFQWAYANLTQDEILAAGSAATPEDQKVVDDAPVILRQELYFPYSDGLLFVGSLLANGGWDAVNAAWDDLPASTEQIMHPELYPTDKPIGITLPDVAAKLGSGWKTSYTQTFGELVTGIWLSDGVEETAMPGFRPPLANASAAAGWGGDRLVSLDGPDGKWAVVWQTAWDTPADATEFQTTAETVMADLAGAHEVSATSIAGSLDSPVLVLVASDQETLNKVKLNLPSG